MDTEVVYVHVSSYFYIFHIKCNKRVTFVSLVTNVTDIGMINSEASKYVPGVDFCVRCRLKLNVESKKNSVALVRERTIPTERPPPVNEVSHNFCGLRGVTWSAQRIPMAVNLCFLDLSRYFLFK